MDKQDEQVSPLLDRIKEALNTPQDTTSKRAQILADISRLQLAVETPLETIYRIGHQVIPRSTYFQIFCRLKP